MVILRTLIAWDILTARHEVANNGQIPPSLNYGPLLEWDVTVDTHAHTHTRKSHTLVLVTGVRHLLASKCVRIAIRCFFLWIKTGHTQWHWLTDTQWRRHNDTHWHNDTVTHNDIHSHTHTHKISLTQQHSQVNKPTNKSQIKSFPE